MRVASLGLVSLLALNAVAADRQSELMKAADAARYKQRDPRRAIELYKQAAQDRPGALDDLIADIEQFDLGDRAAAATRLETLRKAMPPVNSRNQFASLYAWKREHLDAEIIWLKTGKPYDGTLGRGAIAGTFQAFFFGAGVHITNSGSLDPDLNPYSPPSIPPEALARKLMALPPSHTMFLRYWILAMTLPPKDLRAWMTRNDPGGFLAASLLTLGALADRAATAGATDSMLLQCARTKSGQPTGLALLGREYAKKHKLPSGK